MQTNTYLGQRVLKSVNMPKRSRFFRKARRFDAGILCGSQGKPTKDCGKRYELRRVAHCSEMPYYYIVFRVVKLEIFEKIAWQVSPWRPKAPDFFRNQASDFWIWFFLIGTPQQIVYAGLIKVSKHR